MPCMTVQDTVQVLTHFVAQYVHELQRPDFTQGGYGHHGPDGQPIDGSYYQAPQHGGTVLAWGYPSLHVQFAGIVAFAA